MTQRAIDGPYIYFVTTNTTFSRWFLHTPERATSLGKVIEVACAEKEFILFGYCILPNHIHLLIQKHGRHKLSVLMKTIKGRFWRVVSNGSGRRFWQPRFNFRIVDNAERFINTIEYIRYNYQKMDLDGKYGQAPFVFIDWQAIHHII